MIDPDFNILCSCDISEFEKGSEMQRRFIHNINNKELKIIECQFSIIKNCFVYYEYNQARVNNIKKFQNENGENVIIAESGSLEIFLPGGDCSLNMFMTNVIAIKQIDVESIILQTDNYIYYVQMYTVCGTPIYINETFDMACARLLNYPIPDNMEYPESIKKMSFLKNLSFVNYVEYLGSNCMDFLYKIRNNDYGDYTICI